MLQKILLVISLFLIAACTDERSRKVEDAPLISIRIQDDLGQTLIFPEKPARIISLAANITEMIYAVGGEGSLVAVSQACDFPPEAQKQKNIVSTYPELDTESILMQNPDCILATGEIFPATMVSWFQQYKIPLVFQQYDSLEDVYRNMEQIALLCGRAGQGKIVVDSLRALSDSIEGLAEGEIQYSVAVLAGSSPLNLNAGSSYMNDLIRIAGGRNIAGALKGAYAEVTPEFLLKENPDFILIPATSEADALMFLSRYPALSALKAVREKRLIQVDPFVYFRPGPRTVQALMEIHSILHPGEK